jgi:hypothetical protein
MHIMPDINGEIRIELNIGYDDQIYLGKVEE